MRETEKLQITDGRGAMHLAKIIDPSPKACVIEIIETQEQYQKRDYKISVAVAPTKNNDRIEWFAEKATEVGVDEIIPILCAHSERKIFNSERVNKVVVSAVKQSLKAYMPSLEPLTKVKDLIQRPFDGVKLIAHCEDSAQARKLLKDLVKPQENALILIGPEGDFSPEEVALALEHGFQPLSLGEARLRTETAALAVVMNMAFLNN